MCNLYDPTPYAIRSIEMYASKVPHGNPCLFSNLRKCIEEQRYLAAIGRKDAF